MLRATTAWDTDDHCWDDVVDRETKNLYQSYARELGIGSKPALVLIDLYNLVFAGGPLPPTELHDEHPSSCGQYAHAALEPIKEVLALARAVGLPIFHVTVEGRPSGMSATNRSSAGLSEDAHAFHPDLAPVDGETVVRKQRASAFYGTSLVAELVRRGVDSVLVVGESTSGCVRASVVDGYSNGFHMAVVEDGVFDRAWLNHCVSLFDLHHKYADVLRLPTALRLLKEAAA